MAVQTEIQEMPTKKELDTFKQFVSKINPKDAYETAAAEYEKNPDDPFTQAKLKALFPIAKKKMN